MTNTYNWIISAMDRYPTQDSLTGVIHTIHWRVSAVSDQMGEDGNPYTADTYGACSLGEPEAENYIEYEDLTQSTVEGWLESILDVAEIQSNLDSKIDQLINPTNLTDSPPWLNFNEDFS